MSWISVCTCTSHAPAAPNSMFTTSELVRLVWSFSESIACVLCADMMLMLIGVCVCVCVRACVRACVCVCARHIESAVHTMYACLCDAALCIKLLIVQR